MPHTPPIPRIRHLGEIIPQVSYLLGSDIRSGVPVRDRGQSLEHGRDQAGFNSGHGSLTRSWDINNHMINEAVPVP